MTDLSPGEQSLALYRPPQAPAVLRDEDLSLLKDTLTQNLTEAEFRLFVRACRHLGLDPFSKQIYAFKRNSKDGPRLSIQTSIDGFRLIADRTGRYAPGRASTYTYDGEGKLESATAYVKKHSAGEWHEVAETAYWLEYYPGKNQGHMWDKMPHVMLSKVAEARALRRAFPAELSGVYSGEEMEQADAADASGYDVVPDDGARTTEHAPNGAPQTDVLPAASVKALQAFYSACGFTAEDRALRIDFGGLLMGKKVTTFSDLTDEGRAILMKRTSGIAEYLGSPEMVRGFAGFVAEIGEDISEAHACKEALDQYMNIMARAPV